MAIGVNEAGGGGPKDIVGCVDPQASNYNPLATTPCGPLGPPTPDLFGTYTSGCCNYPASNVTGCLDPQANNYDPSAVVPCANCCTYGQGTGNGFGILDFGDIVINPGGGNGNGDSTTTYCSELLFNVSTEGIVGSINGPIKEECCTEEFVGQPVFWDGVYCNIYTDTGENTLCESISLGLISQAEFQNRIVCIDCDNFAWWNNLYTTINGHSLQEINPDLWDFLIDLITVTTVETLFAEGSFYVDVLTGEPVIGEECCGRLPNSNFTTTTTDDGEEISACLCNVTPETELVCECLTSIDTFVSLAASIQGRALLLNIPALTSLGLSTEQAQFVIDNLFNINDFSGDGIPDSVNARILISNALYITGGFYVCYQRYLTGGSAQLNINGKLDLNSKDIIVPVGVTEQKCQDLGGFYDGVLCYCEPIGECNLSLTDLTVTTELDLFNQNITYVTFNGTSISEECCLKIASENNLPWVYEQYQGVFNCFTKDPNPCLPLEFTLNSELIKPICETPLNVSASFYFGIPENSCVEVDTGDDDVIDVDTDTEPCLLTFDENNNLIDYNSTKTRKPNFDVITTNFNTPQTSTEPCCFNPIVPISANLVIKDSHNVILQNSDPIVFNELETWFDLTMQFDPLDYTGTTEGYSVALQFTSGLNCCCTYDIFIDNIKFECLSAQTITEIIKNNCPGFELVPVIDNKKSWVYNPGLPGYSNIVDQGGNKTDENIIKVGEFGLIQGHGVLNRTFAPSPDAELPWRYTDYFNQSSVVEKHSNLVLNSKELFLTFDMCSECCLEYKPCPNGYTLSAGTDTCYKYITTKQFQDGQTFEFQDGEGYNFMD